MTFTPGRDEFIELAADHDMIPVRVELLGDRDTAVSVFETLAADSPDAFLLESVEGGDAWARWSFVGWDALFTVWADADGIRLSDSESAPSVSETDDPLQALAEIVDAHRVFADEALPPLHSGMVGYLAYDVVRHVEHLPNRPADDRDLPTMVWHAVGSLAAVDRFGQAVTLIRNVVPGDDPGAAYDAATTNGDSGQDHDRLLRLFILQKAFYEIGYEAANRPDWLSVPVRGVLSLLNEAAQ